MAIAEPGILHMNSHNTALKMEAAEHPGKPVSVTKMPPRNHFSVYKKSLIHTRPWLKVKHLTKETLDWIETYYDTHRRHLTLKYVTSQEC
jgi:transposase InsO family protein